MRKIAILAMAALALAGGSLARAEAPKMPTPQKEHERSANFGGH